MTQSQSGSETRKGWGWVSCNQELIRLTQTRKKKSAQQNEGDCQNRRQDSTGKVLAVLQIKEPNFSPGTPSPGSQQDPQYLPRKNPACSPGGVANLIPDRMSSFITACHTKPISRA